MSKPTKDEIAHRIASIPLSVSDDKKEPLVTGASLRRATEEFILRSSQKFESDWKTYVVPGALQAAHSGGRSFSAKIPLSDGSDVSRHYMECFVLWLQEVKYVKAQAHTDACGQIYIDYSLGYNCSLKISW